MKLKFTQVLLILALYLLTSSFIVFADKNTKVEDSELLEIAETYIKKTYPDSLDSLDLKPIIIEWKNCWSVTYRLPNLTLGGVPVIHISKKTKMVFNSYHTQ